MKRSIEVPVENPAKAAIWVATRFDRDFKIAIHKWRVAGEHLIDGVLLRETKRPERYVIAHRRSDGRWQATWFDDRGAGGDLKRGRLVDALNDQAHAGSYKLEELHLIADRTTRRNPTMALPTKSIRMFRRFHTRDWRGEGDFHADLVIPDRAICVGAAVNVLYASDKLNPETGEDEGWIDYIHEHSDGVGVYRCDRGAVGDEVAVPAWLRRVDQLTWLGDCLGFSYRDARSKACKAHSTAPLPELFATPNGKALLVIQSKRRLLAILWGGRLGVERRGIVH